MYNPAFYSGNIYSIILVRSYFADSDYKHLILIRHQSQNSPFLSYLSVVSQKKQKKTPRFQ